MLSQGTVFDRRVIMQSDRQFRQKTQVCAGAVPPAKWTTAPKALFGKSTPHVLFSSASTDVHSVEALDTLDPWTS